MNKGEWGEELDRGFGTLSEGILILVADARLGPEFHSNSRTMISSNSNVKRMI